MANEPLTGETLLTPADLCARWRGVVTLKCLDNWIYGKQQKGPKYIREKGKVMFRFSDIEEYELSCRHKCGEEKK